MTLLNQSLAYVGFGAAGYIENLKADICFFSCRGYGDDGVLSDSMEEEVYIRRAMLAHADRKIFLCDRSKYGKSYAYRLCLSDDVDEIISEDM